jgi:hypothetical protein
VFLLDGTKDHIPYNDAYRCGSVFVFLISVLNKLTSFYEICYEQQVTGGRSIIALEPRRWEVDHVNVKGKGHPRTGHEGPEGE